MAKALDVFLRDVASPLLRGRGYRRSGRSFALTTGRDDGALVHFQEFRLGRHDVECFVNLAAIFDPARRWLYRGEDPPARWTPGDWFWWRRLLVPDKHWMELEQLWEFDLCDEQMIDTFRSALPEALDRLEHLAERENMLHALRTDQFYPGEQVLCSHPHGTALLLTDQATSEELDVLLTQLEPEEPDELVAWIRQQLRLEA